MNPRKQKRILELVEEEPLVGATEAARMCNVRSSNFGRDAAPHLKKIPVRAGSALYFVSEVEKFGRGLAERREREAERRAREAEQANG